MKLTPNVVASIAVVAHIPHGSGDAEWRLVHGDTVLAIVDPDMEVAINEADINGAEELADDMLAAFRAVEERDALHKALSDVLPFAQEHFDDWSTGLADGTYDAAESDAFDNCARALGRARALVASKTTDGEDEARALVASKTTDAPKDPDGPEWVVQTFVESERTYIVRATDDKAAIAASTTASPVEEHDLNEETRSVVRSDAPPRRK